MPWGQTIVNEKVRRGGGIGFDAFLVVDIHVEVGAVLLRQCDTLIVDERGMLDRCNAGSNGVLDALGRVGVRLDAETETCGLFDGGAQFLRGEFDGFRIAAVGQDRSGRQHLDVVRTAVREYADPLSHLPGTVGFTEPQIQRQLNIRRQARHGARTLADGDIRPGHIHARTDDHSIGDRVAHGNVVERTIHADIPHRREAGKQREAGIWNGRVRHFHGRSLDHLQGLGRSEIGQLRVTVDKSRQHRHR